MDEDEDDYGDLSPVRRCLSSDGSGDHFDSASRSRSRSPPPEPSSSGDALLDLIALQSFDGSWDSTAKRFFQLVVAAAAAAANKGKSDDAATQRCRDFCAAAQAEGQQQQQLRATALAIAAMRLGQMARKEEWAMIEEKAIDWLEEEAASVDAAKELIDAATKALKPV